MILNEQVKLPEVYIVEFNVETMSSIINRIKDIINMFGQAQPIVLHINSPGGEIYAFSMLYAFLKTVQNPIVTYTSGGAASAGAFLLAMSGTPGLRIATPEATLLLHEIQTGYPGMIDIKDAEDDLKSTRILNRRLLNGLAKVMGLKDYKEFRQVLKDNSQGHHWAISAKKALKLGLIDQIGYLNITQIPQPTYFFDVNVLINGKLRTLGLREVEQIQKETEEPKDEE